MFALSVSSSLIANPTRRRSRTASLPLGVVVMPQVYEPRFILAAVVSPLTEPALVASPWLLLLFTDSASLQSQLPALKLSIAVGSVFSYFGFVLFGVPAVWLLGRYQRLSLLTLCITEFRIRVRSCSATPEI